jgi:hypothetical protein
VSGEVVREKARSDLEFCGTPLPARFTCPDTVSVRVIGETREDSPYMSHLLLHVNDLFSLLCRRFIFLILCCPISHFSLTRLTHSYSLTHPLTIYSHYTTVLLLYYWEKSCHEDEDVDVYEELKSKF